MRVLLILIFSGLMSSAWGQVQLSGIIADESGNPVFAANIYLKNHPTVGTISDFDGQFSLEITAATLSDSLSVSYIGYQTNHFALAEIEDKSNIQLSLIEDPQMLTAVTVVSEDPISEQFAAVKLERLDIYLNPIAAADPLRAITALPASTNTDETANPSLRGSDADRSRVMFNGVPIYRPVRNSQINGVGNFSLFNTEMVDKQYVYASNPPLTYGNTSAGLVEIETINDLAYEQIQLSTSLGNLGGLVSKELRSGAFVQAYSNFQFSDAFIGLNQASFPNLKDFGSLDAGLNFHIELPNDFALNWFSYGITESYEVIANAFAYEGTASGSQKRNFNILNLKKTADRSIIKLDHGNNFSQSEYQFGSLNSNSENQLFYTSLNYQYFANRNWEIQMGITHEYSQFIFRDSIPNLYYDFRPESGKAFAESNLQNHILEVYGYSTWDISSKLQLSAGLRKNLAIDNQLDYWSYQVGLRFAPAPKHSILLSGGRYHNYATPNYFNTSFELLNSTQIALDYTFAKDELELSFATYFKKEGGNQLSSNLFFIQENQFFGIEAAGQYTFLEYFQLDASYSFLDSKITLGETEARGEKDLNYFVKASIQFNHPKLFNAAFTYFGRSGKYFTPIERGILEPQFGTYRPVFANVLNEAQFEDYHNISFSISRYFKLDQKAIIAFMSVNNLFNIQNQRVPIYAPDYSNFTFDYYQLRSIYFGFVWQWNG